MANLKDFATSHVDTAPSPATTGTSLTVTTGHGSRFPASGSFYATAHPDGTLPTLDNAEVVLVSAISTDTFTITRAQKGTSAKSISTGWRISNTVFAADIVSTTADLPDSSDKRYVTDAQLTVLGNTSGTNTGDQDLSGYMQRGNNLSDVGNTTTARSNISAAASGANTDITSITGSAAKLTTARTFRTNLSSTSTASFDGTANVTPGVTGTLPVANGGTGRTTGTTAYGLVAVGTTATGAQQTISPGTSGQFLKSAGASALGSFATLAASDISDLGSATVVFTNKDLSSSTNTFGEYQKWLPGDLKTTARRTADTGWLMCYGQAISRSTYATLFSAINPALGTVTITIASPGVLTLSSHGLMTGDTVYLTTTGALPTGLSANTLYYVIYNDANSFKLATSLANALASTAINTSGSQSGTHTATASPYGLGDGSTTFNVPDMRGRVPAGNDAMGGTGASRITLATSAGVGATLGSTGGAQTHTLTEAEMPSHTHTQNSHSHSMPSSGQTHGNGTGYTHLSGTGSWNFSNMNVGSTNSTTATNQNTGGDGAHNNIQPTIVTNWMIKT